MGFNLFFGVFDWDDAGSGLAKTIEPSQFDGVPFPGEARGGTGEAKGAHGAAAASPSDADKLRRAESVLKELKKLRREADGDGEGHPERRDDGGISDEDGQGEGLDDDFDGDQGDDAPKQVMAVQEVKAVATQAWRNWLSETEEVTHDYQGFVYTQWHDHSFAFSQVAYYNTETLLSLLPDAKYRFFNFAPVQATGYRIADGLSRMQFQRYSKRGYSYVMRMVNEKWGPYFKPLRKDFFDEWPEIESPGMYRPIDDRPGGVWWDKHRFRFPMLVRAVSKVESCQPHPRDAFFNIIVHLYLTGGVYTDHTVAFMHFNPIKEGARYGMYGDGCNGITRSVDVKKLDEWDGWDVALPMVMTFPKDNHPVLKCILEKFDRVAETHVRPEGMDPLEHYCLTSTPNNGTFPFYYVDANTGHDLPPLTQEQMFTLRPGLGGCARYLFEGCMREQPEAPVGTLPIAWGSCTADFHWHQWSSKRRLKNGFNNLKRPNNVPLEKAAGVWTGAGYHGLKWRQPADDHWVVNEIYERRKATRWDDPTLKASLLASQYNKLITDYDVPDADILLHSNDTDVPSCSDRLPTCSHYYSDFKELKGLETSQRGRGIQNMAKAKCSPALIVPGVEKGATTYLFTLLYQHPQILPPLRGAGFKESGAYLNRFAKPKGLWEKIHRFPYIRDGEPFMTGDATILNMMEKGTPDRVLADQPNPRVIFSLRDPVDRAWSGYRFSWSVWYSNNVPQQSFPNIVTTSVQDIPTCMTAKFGAMMDQNGGDEVQSWIDSYYKCGTRKKIDPYKAVWKGVYYYPVLHWIRKLGRENVMVISSEELAEDPKRVLTNIFKFAGLCSEGVDLDRYLQLATKNTTPSKRNQQIGEYGKTPETSRLLEEFYAPYNEMLYKLIGKRFNWGTGTQLSAQPPLPVNTGANDYDPSASLAETEESLKEEVESLLEAAADEVDDEDEGDAV